MYDKGDASEYYLDGLYHLAWTRYRLDDLEASLQLFTELLDASSQREADSGEPSVYAPEARRFMALTFADLGYGQGRDAQVVAADHFRSIGQRPHERGVYQELADVLIRSSRPEEAIGTLQLLQSDPRWRLEPDNPSTRSRGSSWSRRRWPATATARPTRGSGSSRPTARAPPGGTPTATIPRHCGSSRATSRARASRPGARRPRPCRSPRSPPSMPPSTAAEERSVTWVINDDFELRYWILDQRLPDPSDVAVFNYVEQVNRLNLRVASGGWAVDTQIDEVALFANRYYLDDVLSIERVLVDPEIYNVFPPSMDAFVNIEKVKVGFEDRWGAVSLGDAYAAFGRGAALNLNRNVDIDIDTSIQGMKAVLRPGAWDITLVAGQANRQQVFQDNPNIGVSGDLRHAIVGARAERFGLGPANLGGHVVALRLRRHGGTRGGLRRARHPAWMWWSAAPPLS